MDGEQKQQTSNISRIITSLTAGAMAGALAKTVIAPLDRTKISFQVNKEPYSGRSAVQFIIRSYQTNGIFSLWRGNSATLARIVPYAAIQFCAHEQWKRLLHLDVDGPDSAKPFERFLAGALAGVTSQGMTYPLDLARARMAITHKGTYKGLIQVFSKIVKYEGYATLYRGFVPTIMGVIPYAGTSFLTYETLKRIYSEYYKQPHLNPLERLCCGAIAGLCGQTTSYPFDIVRRRMQTATITGNGDKYKTVLGTLRKVAREEGIRNGLFKGLSMNWIKGPVAVGISFSTFDTMQIFLRKLPIFRER